MVKSGEFNDETHWTITLQQPTAVQVEAASGAVVKGTHLCPAKVTVPAHGGNKVRVMTPTMQTVQNDVKQREKICVVIMMRKITSCLYSSEKC
jgi:hypothetical protein